MTSFDRMTQRAARIVENICSRLDEGLIARLADEPIDRAVESFRFVWEQPFDPAQFHRLIGGLVMHVKCCGGLARTMATTEMLEDEAVVLLAQHYQGAFELGYDGALLDIVFQPALPQEGIDSVLEGLAEIMKARRRKEYVDSVFARYLDPLDAGLCRAIAKHVVEHFGPILPQELLLCEPSKLAVRIRYLLESIQSARSMAGQLCQPLPA